MIKEADGNVFEEMRTLNQSLTFNEAEKAFNKYKIDFSEDKFIALGLRSIRDNKYTNLALLLSDQCQHSIKIAVFGDKENTTFKDAKEFSGSIFNQLDEAASYLALCNRTAATFKGLERIEKSDYPEEALREALLNAIIHRDYSFSGSIIINVNDECIEFISIGGLLPGLTEEDIRNGISQPRNKKLADIFHRLKLIESYGTGIRRIYNLYKDCPIEPEIHVTANSFKLILPNMNSIKQVKTTINNISPQMETLLTYLKEYKEITDLEVQNLLNIKKTRSYMITKEMKDLGLIEILGRGDNRKYCLPKK